MKKKLTIKDKFTNWFSRAEDFSYILWDMKYYNRLEELAYKAYLKGREDGREDLKSSQKKNHLDCKIYKFL